MTGFKSQQMFKKIIENCATRRKRSREMTSRFRKLSKNKTSKFQYFAILFIHLCYPHVFALC